MLIQVNLYDAQWFVLAGQIGMYESQSCSYGGGTRMPLGLPTRSLATALKCEHSSPADSWLSCTTSTASTACPTAYRFPQHAPPGLASLKAAAAVQAEQNRRYLVYDALMTDQGGALLSNRKSSTPARASTEENNSHLSDASNKNSPGAFFGLSRIKSTTPSYVH